jgi:RND family efflux transporter MFP subunit
MAHFCSSALVALLALTAGTSVQAAPAAPASVGEIVLTPAQVKALGLVTEPATADRSPAAARYPATVVVPSNQQRVLASPLPALVEQLRASVGDRVRAGQVLALLQSPQLRELQHDAHVARSQAALTAGQLARDEQLFKEGLIAAARVESTRMQAGLAEEQREERELALKQAGGSMHGESGRITLAAPIAGVVLERPAVVGQRVDTAAALYRLAILAPLWLEMQVPARDVATVRLGDPVRVADASASVIAIGHAVDAATQTVLVRAELRQPPASLRAGQAVEAELRQSEAGLVRVPAAALVDDSGRAGVFVATGPGRYRLQPVQPAGGVDGQRTVRGLREGSDVVVRGTAALKSLAAAARP